MNGNKSSQIKSLGGIAAYYVVTVAGAIILARIFPQLIPLTSSTPVPESLDLGRSMDLGGAPSTHSLLNATLSTIGALVLVIPVAWMYTITKRSGGYDSAVVQTVLILPIAVAGIVLIVQHSIALAFSLAGIVAAVRFRNTLKDTRDAVYIFLAIGVGLAAGVQAHAVALVMSVIFNIVVFATWKFGIGETIDDGDRAPGQQIKGVVSVTTGDVQSVRDTVEGILDTETKDWNEASTATESPDNLQYIVRTRKRTSPKALIALLSKNLPSSATAQFTLLDD